MDKIFVEFQLGREILGGEHIKYTNNSEGGINLVGTLFGVKNTYISPRYITCDQQGNPQKTMICIADGMPNRLF